MASPGGAGVPVLVQGGVAPAHPNTSRMRPMA